MAKYLYMDGVDDYLKTPSFGFTDVVLDYKPKALNSGALQYTVDCRELGTGYLYSSGDAGNESFGGWTSVQKNGNQVVNSTNFIIPEERMILKFTNTIQTTPVVFFSRYTLLQYMKVDVFNIKFYNGTTLVAHYDMNTGTVQDQSGNGRHATLVGGTWMDDGIGGEPQGTDVSINYSMSQRLYKDTAINSAAKQLLYANRTANHVTKQTIYKDASTAFNLKNIIYADRSINYAMLQEFFNEGIHRSTNFAMNIAIYRDNQQTHAMRQDLYRAIQDHVDLKQMMYADQQFDGALRQEIHRQLSQNVAMLQRMYDDKQSDYPLLVKILAEYKVYNQIVEREMFICREFNKDMTITTVFTKEMKI